MPVNFAPNEFRRGSALEFASSAPAGSADAAQQARNKLNTMAVSLTDKQGTVKSGYLKLTQGSEGQLRLGRRWFQANAATQDATALVKDLLKQAYGDNPGVQAALERYLQQSGGRLGTKSFVKLVQELSVATTPAQAEQAPAFEPEPVPESALQAQRLKNVRVDRNARIETGQVKGDLRLGALGKGPLWSCPPLHAVLTDATHGRMVSQADCKAKLDALDPAERDQLRNYFKSVDYDRDLGALVQAQPPVRWLGHNPLLLQLRRIDAALRQDAAPAAAQVEEPSAPLLPQAAVDRVTSCLSQVTRASDSGSSGQTVASLRALSRQVSDEAFAQAQQRGKSLGADEGMKMRHDLLRQACGQLTDQGAAQLLHALRIEEGLPVLEAEGGVLASELERMDGGQLTPHSKRPLAQAQQANFQQSMDARLLERMLSQRLRGDEHAKAPAAQMPSWRKPVRDMPAQDRQRLWQANTDRPLLVWAQLRTTLALEGTAGSDREPLASALAHAKQVQSVMDGLAQNGIRLSEPDQARLAQLLMHPAGADAEHGPAFVALLGQHAQALLRQTKQQDHMLSDAQIWETVLGQPVPEDLGGLGDAALGSRMLAQQDT